MIAILAGDWWGGVNFVYTSECTELVSSHACSQSSGDVAAFFSDLDLFWGSSETEFSAVYKNNFDLFY